MEMISREEAVKIVRENVKDMRFFRHMLAVEAIMRGLAEHLGENVELWGLTGLVHDIDYEKTLGMPEKHGIVAQDILRGRVPEEVLNAVKAHNYQNTGFTPKSKMEKALIAADAVSGLIIACALVMPSKKLGEVRVKTIVKKFKSKDFARGVDRNRILMCEEIGVPRREFFEIALNSLKKISSKLNL